MEASLVAKLRVETGAGVMECKHALDDAQGNFEKAKELLANSADAVAKKKAERLTKSGLIESYVHGGRIGVLVEIACESDFVSKNENFKKMTHMIAMQIASMNPKNVDELLKQEYFADPKITIKDYVNSLILQIKENIQIKRFVRYEIGEIE